MYKMYKKCNRVFLKLYVKGICAVSAVEGKLSGKDGAGIVEYGLLAVVGVVLVFMAFNFFAGEMNDNIFPNFSRRIDDIFAVA